VRRIGPGTPLSATFAGPDQSYDFFSSYTLQVPPNLNKGGYAGINFPSLGAGLLPTTIGNLVDTVFIYVSDAAGNPSADAGYRIVAQTPDGKYHITSSGTTSTLITSGCGGLLSPHYDYGSTPRPEFPACGGSWCDSGAGPNDFVPAIGAQPVNKVALMFFGNTNTQQVNVAPLRIQGSSGSFPCVWGSEGGVTGGLDFTYGTTADNFFNFELTENNGP
jgi:hypothetical protein